LRVTPGLPSQRVALQIAPRPPGLGAAIPEGGAVLVGGILLVWSGPELGRDRVADPV